MCLDWQFNTVRGDDDGTYIRLCEMSDDVECLEVVAEFIVVSYRDGEEQPVIFSSVEGGCHRVSTEFFRCFEGFPGKWKFVHINLGSEPAVPGEPAYCVREATVDQVSE